MLNGELDMHGSGTGRAAEEIQTPDEHKDSWAPLRTFSQ
jgi:hypothetical protein